MSKAQQDLVQWLKRQAGYVSPDLSLTAPSQLSSQSVSEERGICSAADISEGSRLLEVPLALCLHLHSVRFTLLFLASLAATRKAAVVNA